MAFSRAEQAKDRGNIAFKSCHFDVAVQEYSSALELYGGGSLSLAAADAKAITHHNRALAFLKQDRSSDCVTDCDHALSLKPDFTKARFTRVKAMDAEKNWAALLSETDSLLHTAHSHQTIFKPAEFDTIKALHAKATAMTGSDVVHFSPPSDVTVSTESVSASKTNENHEVAKINYSFC